MKPCVAAGSERRRWGVLGGTFDPPHYGHLRLAEVAAEQLGLERVLFVPNHCPPHKPPAEVSPAEHRAVMTELACAEHPRLWVSRLELERPGPSYSIDTLRELRRCAGEQAELFFLVGLDSALELPTWREPEAILGEATVVAAPRAGCDWAALPEAIGRQWAARVRRLEMPPVEVSSTQVRELLATGRSARYLLPPAVEAYARKHELYHKEPS